MATPRMDSFTRAYFEAALWASSDESDDQGGEPLDKNYDISDFDPATRDKMIADCADFQNRYGAMLDNAYGEGGIDSGRAGHNFWLSRNGHGTGFFDDDLDDLQEAAKSYGEFNLYVGDPDEDGERLIYGTPLGEYGRPETRPGAREARGAHARAPRVAAKGRWDGSDANERAYNTVHNGLVNIIIDGPTERSSGILEKAKRVLTDLNRQTPPTRERISHDARINQLRRMIYAAEEVISGRRTPTGTGSGRRPALRTRRRSR